MNDAFAMVAIVGMGGASPTQTPIVPPEQAFDRIEAELLAHPQVDIPPVHRFADGIYAREITIPAGVMLTGKIHRTRHLNIISQGEISVFTADEGVKRIKAPFSFIAEAGTRRIGVAHSETVWTTIHANPHDDENLAMLERRLIIPHDSLATTNGGQIA